MALAVGGQLCCRWDERCSLAGICLVLARFSLNARQRSRLRWDFQSGLACSFSWDLCCSGLIYAICEADIAIGSVLEFRA
eukprot:1113875-Rhodomonas_salina.1